MSEASVNPMELSGKRILVAGASSGIGRETAILCAMLGADVMCVARREELLREVVSGLTPGSRYYVHDISELESIDGLIKKIVEENGPLDGFVHSAGVGSYRPLSLLKPEALQDVMQVNFYSFVELVRALTKKKRFNEGFSIVGISSISSIVGNQSKTAYSASKAAMDGAVRCMAKELAPKKIRVNTIAPALIRTALLDKFLESGSDSEDAREILGRQYLGVGEPSDVANTAAFLLSGASKFITGSTIAVDGGRLSS